MVELESQMKYKLLHLTHMSKLDHVILSGHSRRVACWLFFTLGLHYSLYSLFSTVGAG